MADQERSSYRVVVHALEQEHIDASFALQRRLLSAYHHAGLRIESLRKLLLPDHPSRQRLWMAGVVVYDGDAALGSIIVSTDDRLPGIGFFGFYACVDDDAVAAALIDRAERLLRERGCASLRGPVELTIWHSYRFTLHQDGSFFMEPISLPHYAGQFERHGYAVSDRQVSAIREDFTTLLEPTARSFGALHEKGMAVRQGGVADLRALHAIALRTFSGSWSFVPLSTEEFDHLYAPAATHAFVDIAYHGSTPVGFCFGAIDPVLPRTFILKTIAVLPEYQKHGIGAALLHAQHSRALHAGCTSAIYALIRTGNAVTKLPYPGARVIREYVAFEKQISRH